jgi:CheY-like chemotaxis protein
MIRDENSPAIAPVNPTDSVFAEKTKRLNALRILLVEDHHATRSAISALLANEGATVDEALDGGTGLQLLTQSLSDGATPYDALLLDLMLPDMDGEHILQWLQDKRPPAMHSVLVLTGDVVTDRVAQILRLRVDSLIHKPIDIESLVSLLQARAAPD